MINPTTLFKLKNSLDVFTSNHPKFPRFLDAVKNTALEEGTVIEFNVTTVDGRTLNSNLKLTKSDIDFFNELSELK
jgi:hypothetical protein